MAASQGGHQGIVDLLLDRGGSVNQVDEMRQTALRKACQYGRRDIVELLLDRGARVNEASEGG